MGFFSSAFFTSSVQIVVTGMFAFRIRQHYRTGTIVTLKGGVGGAGSGDAELFFPASIAGGSSTSVKWTHEEP